MPTNRLQPTALLDTNPPGSAAPGMGRMWRRRPAARAVEAALCGIALAAAHQAPVRAQAAAARQAQAAQQTYDVPAGPLAPALRSVASSANVLLTFTEQQTAGKTTAGIRGKYAPQAALRALLAGTGLQAVQLSNGSYVLQAAPAPAQHAAAPAAGHEAVLPEVQVRAAATEDGSADLGYLSHAVSQVGPWQGRELQDTPYSMTVISKDLIENLQATTPEQIYRVVPTAQLGEPSYRNDDPTINLRGFLVYRPYRDGMPSDWLGLGTTPENTERVEVLSGLSGFLYGPGNVGGMVNYVSKRPTAERLNRITLGNNGGSNYYAQGDFGGPIDSAGRFGYRINGIWQDGETAISSMDIKKRFISGAFDWHVTDRLLWSFDAAYRDYETLGGPPQWVLAAGAARPPASDIDASASWSQPWKYSRSTKTSYGSQLRWDASDALALRASWLYTDARRNSNQGALNTIQPDGTYSQRISNVFAPGDDALTDRFTNTSGQAYADIQFKTGAVAHKLTVGGQYHKYGDAFVANVPPRITYTGLTLDHPTYLDKPTQPHVDRGPLEHDPDRTETTLLVGDDMTFNEHWSLLAGLAHSTVSMDASPWNESYQKSAFTPNVSLVFKPNQAVTTYATYIQALEQGGVAGNDYNGAPVANAGQVFDPLISHQAEVGVKWSVGGMLLTTALFQIDKALQYYDLGDPNAIRFVQDGREVHRGIEFTAFGRLTSRLSLTGGLTLLDAKVKEQKENPALQGKHPVNVANKLAKLRAEYRLSALPALSLNSSVSYTGRQYGDAMNTDRLPGFTLLDAGARYRAQFAGYPLTLRLDILNLTNKAYWTQSLTLGAPRTVLFSASTEF